MLGTGLSSRNTVRNMADVLPSSGGYRLEKADRKRTGTLEQWLTLFKGKGSDMKDD